MTSILYSYTKPKIGESHSAYTGHLGPTHMTFLTSWVNRILLVQLEGKKSEK